MVARKSQRVGSRASQGTYTDQKAQLDAWLDDALEDTFPASDPIASPLGATAVIEGARVPPSPNQSVRRRSEPESR